MNATVLLSDNHVEVVTPENKIQHIMGSKGIYTQTNVEKRRPYTVEQWHNLCQQVEHRPPQIKTEAARPAPVTPSSRKRFKTDHSGKCRTDFRAKGNFMQTLLYRSNNATTIGECKSLAAVNFDVRIEHQLYT